MVLQDTWIFNGTVRENIAYSNAEFSYRYYRNPVARATVVLLPGGIGLPDLFYLHFERFADTTTMIGARTPRRMIIM